MIKLVFALLLLPLGLSAQMPDYQELYQAYPNYRNQALNQRRFGVAQLKPHLLKLQQSPRFRVEVRGHSWEGRPIYLVSAGRGKTRVLLWSQMHGNEPTATLALLDLFNFLGAEGDQFEELRQTILANTHLYFLPMLNPDGAEYFSRYNAQQLDLNRDARRLAAPESRLLKAVRDSLDADWGFNLHDQNHRYAAGPTGPLASIALLAPPLDADNTFNPVRSDAARLVGQLNRVLQDFIPQGVGRWPDEFEPRAFGENMQIWGTRTVLIESGGYPGDPERQQVRRLNFIALLAGLYQIATEGYRKQEVAAYLQIPENDERYFDLLIRNARIVQDSLSYAADLGFKREEMELPNYRFYNEAQLEDWGDLSTFRGFTELNAEGMQAEAGRLLSGKNLRYTDITEPQVREWLRQGYTGLLVEDLPPGLNYSPFSINLYAAPVALSLKRDSAADLLLWQEGQLKYVVLNGYLIDLSQPWPAEVQGRVEYP